MQRRLGALKGIAAAVAFLPPSLAIADLIRQADSPQSNPPRDVILLHDSHGALYSPASAAPDLDLHTYSTTYYKAEDAHGLKSAPGQLVDSPVSENGPAGSAAPTVGPQAHIPSLQPDNTRVLPEPSSLALIGAGAVLLIRRRR